MGEQYITQKVMEAIKELIGPQTPENYQRLKMAAIKQGMVSLRMSGILKVLDGVTTTEEILRVTMAD